MRLSSTSNHGWTGGHGDADATSGASDAGGHSDGAADATSGASN